MVRRRKPLRRGLSVRARGADPQPPSTLFRCKVNCPPHIPITLSRRQIGDADRVGGIELMILWPDVLGPEPDMQLDHEREATAAEKAHAEALVGQACRTAGLVPVHVRVCRIHRIKSLPVAGDEERTHLAVTIVGQRWVGASTKSRGRVAYAAEAPDERRR